MSRTYFPYIRGRKAPLSKKTDPIRTVMDNCKWELDKNDIAQIEVRTTPGRLRSRANESESEVVGATGHIHINKLAVDAMDKNCWTRNHLSMPRSIICN